MVVLHLHSVIFVFYSTDRANSAEGFQPIWTTAGTTMRITISCGVPPTVDNSEVQSTGIHAEVCIIHTYFNYK